MSGTYVLIYTGRLLARHSHSQFVGSVLSSCCTDVLVAVVVVTGSETFRFFTLLHPCIQLDKKAG